MNYFFKYLVPQILEYFNNDQEVLDLFLPRLICQNEINHKQSIINEERKSSDEPINK